MDAAKNALFSPLLDTGIKGASRCLIAISCGPSVTMKDVNIAISTINQVAGTDTDIKVALNKNPALGDEISISIIATGFKNSSDIISGDGYNYNQDGDNFITENPLNDIKPEEDDIIPEFLNDDK